MGTPSNEYPTASAQPVRGPILRAIREAGPALPLEYLEWHARTVTSAEPPKGSRHLPPLGAIQQNLPVSRCDVLRRRVALSPPAELGV